MGLTVPLSQAGASASIEMRQWTSSSHFKDLCDQVVTEEPLEIQLEERPVSVTMRTPGNDPELAAGFLFSEGIIRSRKDLLASSPFWQHASGNIIGVFLESGVAVDFNRLSRHVFASSSCGLCGKATIDSIFQSFPPVVGQVQTSAARLLLLPGKMRTGQKLFHSTGGLHAAALFTGSGELLLLREDVGRHNAVDKVIGHALLNEMLPLEHHILVVSGRASFEILQKALSAAIPIVAAVSAPSSLAVEFARRAGQTLVGFLRQDRLNIYTHPERVRGSIAIQPDLGHTLG